MMQELDSAEEREARLNAAILSYLSARAAGRTPEPQPFLDAYPELRDDLAEFLEAQGVIEAAQADNGTRLVFGHYEVVRPLNKGGFGEIYLCRDQILNRLVAVKVLKARHASRPDLVLRFLEEAQIASQLQHPGIPPVHEMGQLPDGRPFFSMKLIQGSDLAARLRKRLSPLDDQPAFLVIFQQICQAVAYAHQQKNVLHRDLKPLNVMVGAFGEVQVMDWGLGKVLTAQTAAEPEEDRVETVRTGVPAEQTQPGEVRGTLAYMPPEQAKGEVARQGKWSDVFSLGAILCEILTGAPPYTPPPGCSPEEARDRLREMARAMEFEPAWERLAVCGADPELIALAKHCLAADPGERPPDAGAVADAVTRYLNGVQEQARQRELELAATTARMRSERTRRRLAYGLAAAAVLLAGASLGAGWFYLQQRERQAELSRVESETILGVQNAMEAARAVQGAMRTAPLDNLNRLAEENLALARKAEALARRGPIPAELNQQAKKMLDEAEAEKAALAKDRRLMQRLLEAQLASAYFRNPTTTGGMAEQTLDWEKQFADPFHEWGLDPDRMLIPTAAAIIRARPEAIATELIAGLDRWAATRGPRQRRTLLDLVEQADHPDENRRKLRKLVRDGLDRNQLKELARQVSPKVEASLTLVLLADCLNATGEQEAGEGLLRAAVLARPNDALLRFNYGTRCLVRGGLASAKLASTHDETGKTNIIAERDRYLREALNQYDALRTLRPEFDLLFAAALIHTPQSEDALLMIRKIKEQRPDAPLVHLLEAHALLVKGDAQGSAQAAMKASKTGGNSTLDHAGRLFQVQAALALKDWKKAEALSREIINSYNYLELLRKPGPKGPSIHGKGLEADTLVLAYQGLAGALHGQGRSAEAIKALGEASRIIQGIPSGHVWMAQQREKVKDIKGAENLLLRGVQEDPENVFLILYGFEFAQRQGAGLKNDMLENRLQGVKLPEDPPSLLVAGRGLLKYQQFRLAEQAFRKVLEFDSDHFDGNVNLAAALIQMGKLREAEPFAEKAITLRPDCEAGYWLKGWALYNRKCYADAEAPLRKGVEIKPNDPEQTLMLGETLHQLDKIAEAEKFLRRGLELNPSHPDGHLFLSEVLRAQGKTVEAKEMHDKALQLRKDQGR